MADRPDPVQYLNFDLNTVGTNALVAGQAGKRAYYVNMTLITYGAVTVSWEDTNGINRIGPWSFAANGGIVLSDSLVGWTRSAAGQGINIRLGANVRVAGSMAYRFMPDHVTL